MSNVVECGSELVYFGSRRNILTPRIRIRVVHYLNINTLNQNLKSKLAKKVFKSFQKNKSFSDFVHFLDKSIVSSGFL